jgi:hypothetical protein
MSTATTKDDTTAAPAALIKSAHMLLLLGFMGLLTPLWSDMLIPVLPALLLWQGHAERKALSLLPE